MIDHERKLIFIHIARTGGTSIERAFVGDDWWGVDRHTKHISSLQAFSIYSEFWSEYRKFTVIRNPYDRLVSMFHQGGWDGNHHYHKRDPEAFIQWLQHLQPSQWEKYNSLYYSCVFSPDDIDYILRFEYLQEDMDMMLRSLALDPVSLPHQGKTDRGAYREYFIFEEAAVLAADLFANEAERFGYSF